MRLKDTKRNAHLIEDRTNGSDPLGELLSKLASSQSGLTPGERALKRSGWSVNDLYFARAADSDYDLIPNRGAQYSGGQLHEKFKKQWMEKQLDFLRRQPVRR